MIYDNATIVIEQTRFASRIVFVVLPVVLSSVVDLAGNLQEYYTIAVDKLNSLPENSILKGDILTNAVNGLKNTDLTQYINASDITHYAKGIINVATTVFDVFVASCSLLFSPQRKR